MPKETFGHGFDIKANVRWDTNFGEASITVETTEPFKFAGEDEEFRELWFYFDTEDEINDFIKALKKAKRKTFG